MEDGWETENKRGEMSPCSLMVSGTGEHNSPRRDVATSGRTEIRSPNTKANNQAKTLSLELPHGRWNDPAPVTSWQPLQSASDGESATIGWTLGRQRPLEKAKAEFRIE